MVRPGEVPAWPPTTRQTSLGLGSGLRVKGSNEPHQGVVSIQGDDAQHAVRGWHTVGALYLASHLSGNREQEAHKLNLMGKGEEATSFVKGEGRLPSAASASRLHTAKGPPTGSSRSRPQVREGVRRRTPALLERRG